jgi:hypothetical protein
MRPFQTIAQIIIATSLVNCAPVRRVTPVLPVAGPSGADRQLSPLSPAGLRLSTRTTPESTPGTPESTTSELSESDLTEVNPWVDPSEIDLSTLRSEASTYGGPSLTPQSTFPPPVPSTGAGDQSVTSNKNPMLHALVAVVGLTGVSFIVAAAALGNYSQS